MRPIQVGFCVVALSGCGIVAGLGTNYTTVDGAAGAVGPVDSGTGNDALAGEDVLGANDAMGTTDGDLDGLAFSDDASDGAPSCTGSTPRCSGSAPQTCVDGQWQTGAPCAYVCSSGACTGMCTPQTKQCTTGNTPQTCDSTGTWQSGTACPSVCSAGVCTGACTPMAKQCSAGNTPQTCDNTGAWQSGTACPYVCTNGTCTGECSPNDTGCSGAVPQTCSSSGMWVAGSVTAGYCGAVCAPKATTCNGLVPETCSSSGAWVDGSITGGQCGAVCTPNSTGCNGAVPQTCNAAGTAWVEGSVTAGQCGAACTPGVVGCASTTSTETCGTNGQWETASTCPMGETDQPETCCSGACKDLYGDSSNCGSCGAACSQPNPFCAQATCQCYVSINSCLCAGYCYDLITESCPGCQDNFPDEDTCPSNSCN